MFSRFGRIPSLPTRTSHICMASRAPLPAPALVLHAVTELPGFGASLQTCLYPLFSFL